MHSSLCIHFVIQNPEHMTIGTAGHSLADLGNTYVPGKDHDLLLRYGDYGLHLHFHFIWCSIVRAWLIIMGNPVCMGFIQQCIFVLFLCLLCISFHGLFLSSRAGSIVVIPISWQLLVTIYACGACRRTERQNKSAFSTMYVLITERIHSIL